MAQQMPHLVLASSSPRRKLMLESIGWSFDVLAPNVDERRLGQENAHDYVSRLACMKADAGMEMWQNSADSLVIAADTVVVCGDEILGKPADEEQGFAMLSALSGGRHVVYTGVAATLRSQGNTQLATRSCVVTCEVEFREISDAEKRWYWRTGEPADKAGAYGIQGIGAMFVKSLVGSYSAVVGLPLVETQSLIQDLGFQLPHLVSDDTSDEVQDAVRQRAVRE